MEIRGERLIAHHKPVASNAKPHMFTTIDVAQMVGMASLKQHCSQQKPPCMFVLQLLSDMPTEQVSSAIREQMSEAVVHCKSNGRLRIPR